MVVGVRLGLHGEKVCVTIPAGIVVREAGKYFMLRPFFFVWNREHPQMRKILHFFSVEDLLFFSQSETGLLLKTQICSSIY